MRILLAKFRALFGRRRALESDLAEEIEAHLQMEIEENLSQGMAPQEAQRAARRGFGNKTRVHENVHESWTFSALEDFLKDLAFACRTLRKNPAFTAIVVLTLALGIGGNTAMFTVVRGVLLKPLEFRNPDRLVRISLDNSRQNYHDAGFSEERFETIEKAQSFSQLGAFFIATEDMTLSGGGKPEALKGARVSANFLDILGLQPALGRSFLPEEDRPGGPPVAMISSKLWKHRFGGDPAIVGKALSLNSISYTIIGVLPEGFAFPFPGIDVWVTKPWEYSAIAPRFWRRASVLVGLGRLKPNVSLKQANAELSVLNRQYENAHPADSDTDITLRAMPLKAQMVEKVRLMLWLLFGAVGFVLLIACANVASLLLGRAASRSHEFAIRAALGAGRGRLIRQLLTESLLLSFAGALAGVLLAKWSLAVFKASSLLSLPRASDIHLDSIVLAFTVALAAGAGIFFGLFPSIQASRPNLANMLRERDESGGQTSARRMSFGIKPRSLLVIGQIALSMILLIGASLLMETLVRLHRVNSGFQSHHLLTMQIALPPDRYNTGPKKNAFFRELIRRVNALPDVQSAAAVLTLPMSPKYVTGVQVTDHPASASATAKHHAGLFPDGGHSSATRPRIYGCRQRRPCAARNDYQRKLCPPILAGLSARTKSHWRGDSHRQSPFESVEGGRHSRQCA